MRGLPMRWLGWSLAVLLVLALLLCLAVLGRWFQVAGVRGGWDATLRLMRHGTTTVDDFRHYPARPLRGAVDGRHDGRVAGADWQPRVLVPGDDAGRRDLAGFLAENGTISLVVRRNGALRYEYLAPEASASTPSQWFSVSKSVLAVMVGAAIRDGILPGVDSRVVDHVPELAGRGLDGLSLRHLLTMTSGLAYVESDNPFELHVPFNYTSDIERMIVRFRPRGAPGEAFEYKSGDTALLGLVLSRALAPRTLSDYAQARLWSALPLSDDGVWSLDRDDGLEKVWCCLAGSARDLARIGELYLDGGVAQGTRIVAADWIAASVGSAAVAPPMWPASSVAAGFRGYGYGWWLLSAERGDYLAQGKDGQFLYVDPSRAVVIARLGRSAAGLRASQWAALFRSLADAAP
ncbi:MAG: serine hydrolase [Xanthomonadales bacterium]|nr:serine hydrolase [Xanthomonadales bacterium]